MVEWFYLVRGITYMRLLIANLMVLVSLAIVAHADDGWVEVTGGSARLLEEHPTISMTDEYVLIELMPDKYRVTANFHFYNSGLSTTVAVGFPVAGSTEGNRRDFLSFKTWVNGLPASVNKLQEHPEEADYKYFKVKTVRFVSQSTTTSIVEYEAPYGHTIGPSHWVSYDYSTGRSWNGPIGKVIIDLRFPEDLLGFNMNAWGGGGFELIRRAPGQMVLEMNEVKPTASESFMASFKFMKNCLSRETTEAAGLYGDCCHFAGIEEENVPKASIVRDISKYSTLAVLKLQRNAHFARHGRVFKDQALKDFFPNMKWYSPRSDFKESDLSEADKQKIKEIQGLEESVLSVAQSPVPFKVPKE